MCAYLPSVNAWGCTAPMQRPCHTAVHVRRCSALVCAIALALADTYAQRVDSHSAAALGLQPHVRPKASCWEACTLHQTHAQDCLLHRQPSANLRPACTTEGLCIAAQGLSEAEARAAFWVIDKEGLVTSQRSNLTSTVKPFARTDPNERDGEDLLSVVKRVKPTVLVRLWSPDLHAVLHVPWRIWSPRTCFQYSGRCRTQRWHRAPSLLLGQLMPHPPQVQSGLVLDSARMLEGILVSCCGRLLTS